LLTLFRLPDFARFVDLFASEAEIRDRRDVLLWNIPLALPTVPLNLAPLLGVVVLVR
jgi:hypothetical protein